MQRKSTSGCRWYCTFAIGAGVFISGVYGVLAQPAPVGIYSRSASAYLLLLLGCAIVGSSIFGVLFHWGPLISTFVITASIGIIMLPATNSPRADTMYAASVLGFSVLVAFGHAILRSFRSQTDQATAHLRRGSDEQLPALEPAAELDSSGTSSPPAQ